MTEDLALGLALLVLCAGCAIRALGLWTGRNVQGAAQPPAGWPFSNAGWRAYNRALPSGSIALGMFVIAAAVGVLSGRRPGPVATAVAAVAGVLMLGFFGVMFLIALFNHPKWLVPPALRSWPGFIRDNNGNGRDLLANDDTDVL